MPNRHLINQQKIALRMGNHQEAIKVQQEISSLYWRQIVPAFEGLFDKLAGPDVLVKLDLLEIDLGNISTQDLHSPLLVDKMLNLLEAAIMKAMQNDPEGNVTKPMHLGQFQLWLYFLEHGYLPTDSVFPKKPLTDWYNDIFETLAREESAIDRLSRLISTCPQAMERLILQYDSEFLQQIVVLYTGYNQKLLPAQISELAKIHTEAILALMEEVQKQRQQESEIEAIADELLVLFLEIIPSLKTNNARQAKLKKKLMIKVRQEPSPIIAIKNLLADADFLPIIFGQETSLHEIQKTIHRFSQMAPGLLAKKRAFYSPPSPIRGNFKRNLLRQLEINAWRILLNEVMVQRKKAATEILVNNISHHKTLQAWKYLGEENINYINKKIKIFNLKNLNKPGLASFSPLDIPPTAIGQFKEELLLQLKEKSLNLYLNKSWGKKSETTDDLAHIKRWIELKKKLGIKGEPDLGKIKPLEIPENPTKEPLPSINSNFFYIPHAGIILLHPFLSTFFQKLELTKGSEFTDLWQHQKAILLLHFLATGEEKGTEFDLVLPKHLCGWPLNLPIDHTIDINPEEMAEGENLLRAVIDHWGALGSTSIDGLREGFLQREGKLENKQNGWLLRVEQKTMDILLDRLPWNLSLIKLPWMEDMLKVEWK